jgi:hypothetical protein
MWQDNCVLIVRAVDEPKNACKSATWACISRDGTSVSLTVKLPTDINGLMHKEHKIQGSKCTAYLGIPNPNDHHLQTQYKPVRIFRVMSRDADCYEFSKSLV